MVGHVHAELMRLYSEDAKETDKPWRRWQFTNEDGEWEDFYDGSLKPVWDEDVQYRRKPKTISINGFEVPMAISKQLEVGQDYFVPDIADEDLYSEYVWMDDALDRKYLDRQIIHLTKEAAIAHAKALLSFTERKE